MIQKYIDSTFAPEKDRVLGALAHVNQPYLQMRTLDFAISGKVRKQDIMRLISSVAVYSPMGHMYTWNWLRSNWKTIMHLWKGLDYSHLNGVIQTVTSRFIQPVLVQEAEDLFLYRKDPDFFIPPRAPIAVAKGLEIAKQRIEWLRLYEKDVESWLVNEESEST